MGIKEVWNRSPKKKRAELARALGYGADVVCLVPSATDLEWWYKFAMNGEIRFIRGRPRFVTKEGKWQQTFSPSTIVIFRHADLKTHAQSKIVSFNKG